MKKPREDRPKRTDSNPHRVNTNKGERRMYVGKSLMITAFDLGTSFGENPI